MAQVIKVSVHKSFKKSYRKRIVVGSSLDIKTEKRISLFARNPNHPSLKDHSLTGKMKGLRSFWITGDIRIVYLKLSTSEALFLDIGSHNQVY